MSFSQAAASNFVPLLARIVLAAVFIPAGYHKLMDKGEFAGEDARRLRELKVVAVADSDPMVRLVALQETPATPPSGAPTSKPTSDEAPKDAAGGTPPAPGGEPVQARELHRVTLLVDKMGWNYAPQLGWLAALTELVGGTLIFIGLFSRLWALGLAVVMVNAFILTNTGKAYLEAAGFFGQFALVDFNRFAGQAALFVLAFGVMLTGAGRFSFDRMVFGGGAGNGGGAKKPADE